MNSRRRHSGSRAVLWAGVPVVALLLLVEYVSGGVLRTALRDTSALVWVASSGAYEVAESLGGVRTRTALARENVALREERDRLRTMQLQNDVLRSENTALRALLSMGTSTEEGVAARVLSRPFVSGYNSAVIGAGTNDGVSIGDVALIAPGIALGDVVEAGTHTSLVALYTAPGRELEVLLHDGSSARFIGRGGGTGLIEVPRGVPVVVGDTIVLADAGLLIGTVGDVAGAPQDAFQRVLVAPPAVLGALRFVSVVRLAH